jgi:hypothetical protein
LQAREIMVQNQEAKIDYEKDSNSNVDYET